MAGYNSTGAYTAGICEQILSGLENYAGNGNLPSAKRSYLGYLEFLQSDLNKGNTEVIPVITDSTKYHQVRVKYSQRTIDAEVTEAEDGNCTPERYPDYLETTFDVDKVVSFNFGLKKREVVKICNEGNTSVITNKMNESFDAIARKINTRLLTIQSLNFGANVGNSSATSAKSVNVLVAATGAPLATGIQALNQDYYEKNQYFGTPAIIGAGNIMKYWATVKTGCCNQDGVDMNAMAAELGWAPFLDTQIESVLGSNQFMVLAPGMNQLVTYNRYVGENEGMFGTSMDTTVVDPRTGLRYDMKIDYDGCNEAYYVRLTLNYGLWIQPVDTFNAADPLYRTNGSCRYTAATT